MGEAVAISSLLVRDFIHVRIWIPKYVETALGTAID